jgi:Big-like domain-containing protein
MRRPFVVVSVLAMLVGCDSSNPTRPDTAARVTGIGITGDSKFTDLNQVHSLTAMAQLAGASPRDITGEATWQSSDAVVATVSPRGEVKSVGFGAATITAIYQGHQAVTEVVVVVTDTTAQLAGPYRLVISAKCQVPDWAQRREYDSIIARAVDRSWVLAVEQQQQPRRQFEFVASQTSVTIDFPTQLSYGDYGQEVPTFYDLIDDQRVFTVQGTGIGTLHGTSVSGTISGRIGVQDFARGTITTCVDADFSVTRQ